jgi:C-terminal processing protease CtpA/Prc
VTYSGVGGRIAYTQDKQGIRFTPVTGNAPVAQAGLTPEDVVIEVDGKPISSFSSLTEMSRAIRGEAGSTVTFTVVKANGAVIRQQVLRAQVTYER